MALTDARLTLTQTAPLEFTVASTQTSGAKTLPAPLCLITASDDINVTFGTSTTNVPGATAIATPDATSTPIWARTYMPISTHLHFLDQINVYNGTANTVTVWIIPQMV